MSGDASQPDARLRPRDLALLMLASGDLRPRRRARDQQADTAGLDLKRRILERVAARDPEPAELEAVLVSIVDEVGPPSGPARAVAASVQEEWRTACAAPEWVAYLLEEALREGAEGEGERGRRVP
jgi:hypothetical protein